MFGEIVYTEFHNVRIIGLVRKCLNDQKTVVGKPIVPSNGLTKSHQTTI